jgi:cell division protein FtsW
MLSRFSKTKDLRNIFILISLFSAAAFLILRQPDIGTLLLLSLIFFIQLVLTDFFKLKYCLYAAIIFIISSTFIYKTSPHVSERVNNFLAGVWNVDKTNYQVRRSLMAYGNAGWLGKGFLEGEIKNQIPDVHTDFIFPAVAEEFGFIVVFLIVFAYFYISFRTLLIAKQKRANYEFLALCGLSLLLFLQTCINLCVSLNLAPTKGITLPFLSYGGSSMLGTAVTAGYTLVFTKKEFGLTA